MRNFFLAILSGLLLAFSWPSIGFFAISFFAFFPLLLIEDEAHKSSSKKTGIQVFFYAFLTFFIFNTITTYWIVHASLFGGFVAFLVNSTLMSFAFYLFHKVKVNTNDRFGYLAFFTIWISMEYINLNWDLSWPWLTLGNVFAPVPFLVQWYEFTGFLSGSFWVLLINLLLFLCYKSRDKKKLILSLLFFLLMPFFISMYMFFDFNFEENESLNVLIVQPNVDPYLDKFNVSYKQQLNDFIDLAKTELTIETELLVGPETALIEGLWEDKIESAYSIIKFRELQKQFPNLNILVGASTYKAFRKGEEKTNTAREIRSENIFYDIYNSAVFIPKNGDVTIYHKTKLVPGVEKMPLPSFFDPLVKLVVNLGGISGSLGSSNTITNFDISGKNIRPLICYESIYGEMDCSNSGLIAIITNDGWWKNTAGYKQHFEYAGLRAIEQRSMVIRSANTGVSGYFNAKGEPLKRTKWNEKVCIPVVVKLNNNTTFYAKFGNYIGRLSIFVACIILVVTFVKVKLVK